MNVLDPARYAQRTNPCSEKKQPYADWNIDMSFSWLT